MKVLSVKNPWAYLVCAGYKDVENRTWRTNYTGRVLIHVPAKFDNKFTLPYNIDNIDIPNNLISSAIIGEVTIRECSQALYRINSWAQSGCWHWILDDPILYNEPILNIKGKLGLWEYY